MTDKLQPPDGYELWSPKKGDVYPQGYLYGGDHGYRWVTGTYPGRDVQDDLRGLFCKPIPVNKTDPNPQGQLTMDKAFITKRPPFADLYLIGTLAHDIEAYVVALGEANDAKDVTELAEDIDLLVNELKKSVDSLIFTDHKDTSNAQ